MKRSKWPKLAFVLSFFIGNAYANSCPIAPYVIRAQVESSVKYDPKTKLYTYRYSVFNDKNSPLPIESFAIPSKIEPKNILSPPHWKVIFDEPFEARPAEVYWNTIEVGPKSDSKEPAGGLRPALYGIQAGKKLDGFSFQSPYPPGPQMAYPLGRIQVASASPRQGDDEPEPDCPDLYIASKDSNYVTTVIGPTDPGVIPVSLRLRGYRREFIPREFHPKRSTEKVVLIVKSGKDFNPKDLDLSTIAFGPAGAKPIDPQFDQECKDRDEEVTDWEKAVEELDLSPKEKRETERKFYEKKNLALTFKVLSLGIRCHIDQALFFSAKTKDGKAVFGGVPIKLQECEPQKPPRKTKG